MHLEILLSLSTLPLRNNGVSPTLPNAPLPPASFSSLGRFLGYHPAGSVQITGTSSCVVPDTALFQRAPRAKWSRGSCLALANPEELAALRGSRGTGPVLGAFMGDLISCPSNSETDIVSPCLNCRKETQKGEVSAQCHRAF